MKYIILSLIVVFGFSGCASVKMGSVEEDAALKRFIIAPDKSAVYIYRNESFGGAIKMDVEVDGKTVGQTAAKTFFYKELEIGKHTITSRAENNDSIDVEAKPGVLIYIWQEVKMGIMYARTKLHLVNEGQGKLGVRETMLAEPK